MLGVFGLMLGIKLSRSRNFKNYCDASYFSWTGKYYEKVISEYKIWFNILILLVHLKLEMETVFNFYFLKLRY